MSFTFTEVCLETLEIDDLKIKICESAFSCWRDGTIDLERDPDLIEIYLPRANRTDILLNPVIPKDEWDAIFSELDYLCQDEKVEDWFQSCRDVEKPLDRFITPFSDLFGIA